MHFHFRNVNDAFRDTVDYVHSTDTTNGNVTIHREMIRMPSRYGDVLMLPEPMTLTYHRPQERVLFNGARDANPFFHLYEALWMLAGYNDVKSLEYYVKRMRTFSDDGLTLHDAYGHRWHFLDRNSNQLSNIIRTLKGNRNTRRAVLQMWSVDDLRRITFHPESKAVPCNLSAVFQSTDGTTLDMTVFNRSNDLIWGMLGANYVHFSYLLEYIARATDMEIGEYHQCTANLHVYTDNWKPDEWLADDTPDIYSPGIKYNSFPLFPAGGYVTFITEVTQFVATHGGPNFQRSKWSTPFFRRVAEPMCIAFHHHKKREYPQALAVIEGCEDRAWKEAGKRWLEKRARLYDKDGPNYTHDEEEQ